MKFPRIKFLLFVAVTSWSAFGQQGVPHLAYVYPAGGQRGTSVEVVLGGQFLNGATNGGELCFSGSALQGNIKSYTRPMTPAEANTLRDQMKKLQETATPADRPRLREMRLKLAQFALKRNASPVLAENVSVQVNIDSNAVPGEYELRLRTPAGLSNPLRFWVDRFAEFRRPEPPPEEEPARLRQLRFDQSRAVDATESQITLPAVVNGQILPGGVDRYRFFARRGQRLVVAVRGRELMPYLADAVPGWFQPAVSLQDAQGRELAFADHYEFRPDPLLCLQIPAEGEYSVAVRDSIYRGREDFVYRLTIGELPVITAKFPLGGTAGTVTPIVLSGWNLATNRIFRTNEIRSGFYELSAPGLSSAVDAAGPFKVESLPETFEQEPNNSIAHAQKVQLPLIVNGRIDQPGDRDLFRFEGHSGQTIVAEVLARRLGSPLDSFIKLLDSHGSALAANDDCDDLAEGLETHHADSYLRTNLPATGTYYLEISDVQNAGGPDYAYRLRLSEPEPDFDLRLVPSSVAMRGGLSAPLTVFALRRDGFTNAIDLSLVGTAAGFHLAGGTIPAGQEQVRVTLSGPESQTATAVTLQGRAKIGAQEMIRDVVPADNMEQAFMYHHLVPAKELRVTAANRPLGRGNVRLSGELPLKIPAGGKAELRLSVPGQAFAERFRLELDQPPPGITLAAFTPSAAGASMVLQCERAKALVGLKGNLIVNVVAKNGAGKKGQTQVGRRPSVGTLPAIPFEIVSDPVPP